MLCSPVFLKSCATYLYHFRQAGPGRGKQVVFHDQRGKDYGSSDILRVRKVVVVYQAVVATTIGLVALGPEDGVEAIAINGELGPMPAVRRSMISGVKLLAIYSDNSATSNVDAAGHLSFSGVVFGEYFRVVLMADKIVHTQQVKVTNNYRRELKLPLRIKLH
jgi:hypothetical protein